MPLTLPLPLPVRLYPTNRKHRQTLPVLIKQRHESTAWPTNCFTTGDANAAAGPAAAALDVSALWLSSGASSACADQSDVALKPAKRVFFS